MVIKIKMQKQNYIGLKDEIKNKNQFSERTKKIKRIRIKINIKNKNKFLINW